jgi:Domain of unknown function (DUF4262)
MRLPQFPRWGRKYQDPPPPERLYAGVAALTQEIETSGWTTVSIDSDNLAPPWAYSVGLWITHRGTDLAMFGVPPDLARAVFDQLGTRMADGWLPTPGECVDDIGTRPLKLCRIHQSWRQTGMFAFSDICHGLVRPPMLQVVWPDADDCFPGEPGRRSPGTPRPCDIQPLCWLPVEDNPPSAWTALTAD